MVNVHTRKIPLAPGIDLEEVALATEGYNLHFISRNWKYMVFWGRIRINFSGILGQRWLRSAMRQHWLLLKKMSMPRF